MPSTQTIQTMVSTQLTVSDPIVLSSTSTVEVEQEASTINIDQVSNSKKRRQARKTDELIVTSELPKSPTLPDDYLFPVNQLSVNLTRIMKNQETVTISYLDKLIIILQEDLADKDI
jgi:hypothetical protein